MLWAATQFLRLYSPIARWNAYLLLYNVPYDVLAADHDCNDEVIVYRSDQRNSRLCDQEDADLITATGNNRYSNASDETFWEVVLLGVISEFGMFEGNESGSCVVDERGKQAEGFWRFQCSEHGELCKELHKVSLEDRLHR
jgi:hypothetical protein